MKRLLNFSASYPWLILTALVVITFYAATTLSSLRIQVSAESLTVEDDPAWIAQQQNLKQFGDSEITVILFQDTDLFTKDKLSDIKLVLEELSKLPEISGITSLFSVANIRMVDEYISTKPFIEKIPESNEELKEILAQARLNPLVIKNLINEDGTAFAINLILNVDSNNPEFDQQVSQAIQSVIEKHQSRFEQISQIGSPYIRDTITKKISSDQKSIMPWSIVFLVVALAIGMRRMNGAGRP